MALPNIFHGTTVLAPGEAGNKNNNWVCDGRTQFYWLRYAQQLSTDNDAKAPRALAIATALQALDAKPAPRFHEDDPEDATYWYSTVQALFDAMEAGKALSPWDAGFVTSLVTTPPARYSPKRKEQLTRMAARYLGERVE